jgi:aspartyl protease family protein
MVPTRRAWPSALGAVLLLPAACLATDVSVVGLTPGQSAEIIIDGGPPVTIEVGEAIEGVRLLDTEADGAVLRIDGVTKTLPLVAHQPGAGDAERGGSVTLSADARGHFVTRGTVNGRPVEFLVDTGATLTTLSRDDAKRIGLEYEDGTPIRSRTANGVVQGWRVSLDTVRVGDATVRDVAAMVIDTNLGVGLLGMSFLDRFDIVRRGSTLVLQRRR